MSVHPRLEEQQPLGAAAVLLLSQLLTIDNNDLASQEEGREQHGIAAG
jgi:hypothetical protein